MDGAGALLLKSSVPPTSPARFVAGGETCHAAPKSRVVGKCPMKRILLGALLIILIGCAYFGRSYLFDAAPEPRARPPAAAQPVIADVAVETPMPIQITAIGSVQSIATVMIKSRIDGQIKEVHFREGQEGQLAARRAAAGSLPVVATIPSEPQTPIAGVLVFIDNQVDVGTGTITLKAEFANNDTRMWPGQFVNVTLTLGMQADAVVVPSAAVQIGENGPYVFLLRLDSTVEMRLVAVDRTLDGRTVVAEGLAARDRALVGGHPRLP